MHDPKKIMDLSYISCLRKGIIKNITQTEPKLVIYFLNENKIICNVDYVLFFSHFIIIMF